MRRFFRLLNFTRQWAPAEEEEEEASAVGCCGLSSPTNNQVKGCSGGHFRTKLPLFLSVGKQQKHTIRSSATAISQRRDNYRQQHTEHTHTQPSTNGLVERKTRKKQTHCHAQTTIIKTPANLKPRKNSNESRRSERECRS